MPKGIYKHKKGIKKHSEEWKQKLRERMLNNNPFKGKHHKEETLLKIVKKLKGRTSPFKGKKHTKESIEKLRQSHLNNPTRYWLGKKRFDISGEKCHLWKGGISKELYTINWKEDLRIAIRKRDRCTCQLCKEPQRDIALSVHHIDYNKKNCNPDNLISLCIRCHIKTNTNRDFWEEYLNSLKI